MSEFTNRLNILFPNRYELIEYCLKEIYITTFSEIINNINDYRASSKYAMYKEYYPLDIKFFCWKEFEETDIFFPDFIEKIEVKVSQKSNIAFSNIYINDHYVGNFFYDLPTRHFTLSFYVKSDTDKLYYNHFYKDNVNTIIKFCYMLIQYSFAYIYEQNSTSDVFSLINEVLIS